MYILMLGLPFQVLLSVRCVLVTPKRKLAGHLAVMKTVLHFFGEFLVEGTGGSSVFKDFHGSSSSDLNKSEKQKFLKWPEYIDLNSEKGLPTDNAEAENLNLKSLKNVKRHRRWNIGKVGKVFLYMNLICMFYTKSNSILLILLIIDKSCALDTVFA